MLQKNITNICIIYMSGFIPTYENDRIKFCQFHCEIGKEEKCLTCKSDNITCINCNLGY